MTKNGKINWTAVSVTIGFMSLLLGWAWSIESRLGQSMDVSGRLKVIEEALYPILVDYKVNQILKDHDHEYHSDPTDLPVTPIVSTDPPEPEPIYMLAPAPVPDDTMRSAERSAEEWAQEQLIYSN